MFTSAFVDVVQDKFGDVSYGGGRIEGEVIHPYCRGSYAPPLPCLADNGPDRQAFFVLCMVGARMFM